ncbi:hypothetical protein [Catellatospora methionotrophica]|uniref:hypothetical protein n=1 Tax=Catellatospora methionotrophica TaxID=121620 RepID=UPI0033D59B43
MEDDDRPHYLALLRSLELIEPWLKRMDPESGRMQPGARSPLLGDDNRLHPYETSHATWHSLSHAVDHLHLLQTVLRDARVIHMYAPYSLIRGALENAAAAVWMLEPSARSGRLVRRMRLAAADIRNGEKAKELIGHTGPRPLQGRLDDLRKIAANEALDEKQALARVGYEEIVREAGRHTIAGDVLACLVWKVSSGIAHGDLWTTLNVSDRMELPGAPPGIAHLRITANMEMLKTCVAITIEMTALGWHLLDMRSRSPY